MLKTTVLLIGVLATSAFVAGCGTDTANVNVTNRTAVTNTNTVASGTPMANTTPMTNTNMGNANTATGVNIRVADITGNPTNYIGKTVTVIADVEEVWGPRAFSLDEDAPAAGGIDNDLVVLSPQAGRLANIDDQWRNNKVRVTGTVRLYVLTEIEREIGWDLDPKIEAELEDREQVLIANAIERVPNN